MSQGIITSTQIGIRMVRVTPRRLKNGIILGTLYQRRGYGRYEKKSLLVTSSFSKGAVGLQTPTLQVY